MSDIQRWIDNMSAQWRKKRAETQMTLGALVQAVNGQVSMRTERVGSTLHTTKDAPERVIARLSGGDVALGGVGSYRGYYSDLAFTPVAGAGSWDFEDFAIAVRGALGWSFTGYKGGEFRMDADTPLWVAGYGSTGERVMSTKVEGESQYNLAFVLVCEPEEESA